jgi:hypothetical protein
MTKLLNIDSNAKTVKGQKHGYLTGVMYLAPYKISGYNVCPTAELAGCWKTCLNTAGRASMPVNGTFISPGGIELPDNAIHHARIRRTKLWIEDKVTFWDMLTNEIFLLRRRAKRVGLIPVVRLNGTSDILWERERDTESGKAIFDLFPDIQFYDYTKLPARLSWPEMPGNYHLTVSYSEASPFYTKQCQRAFENGAPLVAVVKDQALKDRYLELGAVDMDEHDLRFVNPPNSFGVLKAKGLAKKETNGFVLQEISSWIQAALNTRSTKDSKQSNRSAKRAASS